MKRKPEIYRESKMKEEDIDKLFREAAEKQEFLFSTGAWERAEAVLDSNAGIDTPFVKASESYNPPNATPTSAGFAQVLQQQSRSRRSALFIRWGSVAAVFMALFATVSYMGWESASTRRPENSMPQDGAPYGTTAPKTTHSAADRTPIENLTEESEVSNEGVLAGETGAALRSVGASEVREMNANQQTDRVPASVLADRDETVQEIALERRPYAVLPVLFADLPVRYPTLIESAPPGDAAEFVSSEQNPAPADQNLFMDRLARKPMSNWSVVVAGRSMRLTDVPEGFDISKYSPEIGVEYRLMDKPKWSLNAELSGYWVAGTLGKVTFARKVAGFGDATEYRYLSADQAMQLELPVYFNWNVSPRQSIYVGVNQTYMLPTEVTVEEETVDWFGTVERSEKVQTGYIYGLRRYNVALSAGISAELLPSVGVHGGVSYYFLDRDLLDAEALAPIPWQLRFGIHYRI